MTRKLPTVRAGTWFHLVNRGIDGSALLPTPQSRDLLVFALGVVAHEHPIEIHAYCVMETHYHVLARAGRSDLVRAFSGLEADCSLASEGGRLRGMAFGRHMLQVTRYIHRNPVEAGLVSRPERWRWSSYAGYVDPSRAQPWLRSSAVLGWLGSIGGRQRYRRYVEERRRYV